jgi:hypothetical protein
VPWLTPNREAKSISLGIASPGFHSPDRKLFNMNPFICWYSGLKAAVVLTPICPAESVLEIPES